MEEINFGAQHRMSKHSTYELCSYPGSFSYHHCLGRFLLSWTQTWSSQVAQWQRICLPMQEIEEVQETEETQQMWVQSLGQEDPLE